MTLRSARRWLWVAVAATAGALVGAAWTSPGYEHAPTADTRSATPLGGEFSLVDEDGKPRTWSDFRGRPVAVFFGFMHCPDICPTTLGELSVLLDDLGEQANELQVVLISGDPERDTPGVLPATSSHSIRGSSALRDRKPRLIARSQPLRLIGRRLQLEVVTTRSTTQPGSTSTTGTAASP